MSSPALVVSGMLAWGCMVYDTDMLPATGGLSGDGASSGSGGSTTKGGESNNAAGSSATTAGKSPNGGTEATDEGGAPGMTNGGTESVAGETGDDGEGGEGATGGGGASPGGSGGGGGAAGKGGSGGSGGTQIACDEHPIPPTNTWVATASHSSLGNGMESDGLYNPPAHMVDGKYNERWASGKPQAGDEWIQIDFGVVVNLSQVTLHVSNDTADYPRAYAVRVSNTSQDFNSPAKVSGVGATGNTVVTLPTPATGRYLTVRQTGVNPAGITKWWTISEVLVTCTN